MQKLALFAIDFLLDKWLQRCYNFYAVGAQARFDIDRWAKPIAIVRVDCHVGPPVPIPNTEVKHMYADDSCRATGRENR